MGMCIYIYIYTYIKNYVYIYIYDFTHKYAHFQFVYVYSEECFELNNTIIQNTVKQSGPYPTLKGAVIIEMGLSYWVSIDCLKLML